MINTIMATLRFKIKEIIEILEYSHSPSRRIELLNKYKLGGDTLRSIRDALIKGKWRVLG